jgi:hypothetical protein
MANDQFLGIGSGAWAAIASVASVIVTTVLAYVTARYARSTAKILAATERQAAATEASVRLLTRDAYVKQIPLRVFIDAAGDAIDRFLSVDIALSRTDRAWRSCHPPSGRTEALAAAEQISTPATVLARSTIERHERAANPGGVIHAFNTAQRDSGDIDAAERALRSEFLEIKKDYEKLRAFLVSA